MSRRPPTRSPAATSDAADRLAERPTPARPHVVDRALAVHRLLADGLSSADVQRRLRVSKSTVSVLGYLGAALAGMERASVVELRAPAVTARDVWRLATAARTAERAARADAVTNDDRDLARRRAIVALRSALRDHVIQARLASGVSFRSARRSTGPRASDRSAAARAVGWSHAAWATDPVAFAKAHLAALAAAHGHVAERAARTVALAGAEHALTGQVAAAGADSLHRLSGARWRALAATGRSARTPAEERALGILAVLTRKLREVHDEIARLRDASSPASTKAHIAPLAAASLPDQTVPLGWADIGADLG